MESLPEEVLFMIFQNLEPLELISLSRVNRRWHEVALHPRLHRCINFQQKHFISTTVICKYISKFKHSLEELNLQECYWLKVGPLSSALQKCRKLTSLNVMGCDISKKTICSVLKLNNNLKSLEWSVNHCDLSFPIAARGIPEANLGKLLFSFCNGLVGALSGLECLTIRFPPVLPNFTNRSILNFGVPFICSELCLKKVSLQWLHVAGNIVRCCEIAIKGSRFQLHKSDFTKLNCLNTLEPPVPPLTDMNGMVFNTVLSAIEHGTLHTLLMPNNSFNEICSSLEKIKTKTCIVNLDVGFNFLDISANLTSAALCLHSLRYLNLKGTRINGHILQVIATLSPNLEILNLQDCITCLVPLQGLKSLAACCTKLAELNLEGVHYGAPRERPNDFMEIISKFTSLVSLSLCVCGLGAASESKSVKTGAFKRNMLKNEKRVCRGASTSLSSNSSTGPETKSDDAADSDIHVTPWHNLTSEESFNCLTKACSKITEFELTRPFSAISFEKSHFKECGPTVKGKYVAECLLMKGSYHTLMTISKWRSLQRLTLAVPFMQGNFEYLVAVTQNCSNLQFLSLATMANLGHSGNVVLLQEALSHCHQLRDFRLEQPNFNITESFILTLGELKHLERVCIIARQGAMKMYSQVVISLFEKCSKLFYFQVLCDITIKASKSLVDSVTKRFAETRPGLVVSVLPYCQGSTGLVPSIVKSLPVVHLKEMFLFGTDVATRVPV